VAGSPDNLSAGDLTIELAQPGATSPLGLRWIGKSNARDPEKVLGPYLAKMLDRAVVQCVPLELYFEKLDYLNSLTLTTIIQVIRDARALGVKLVIVFDPTCRWQRMSLDALRIFVNDDGLIELRTTKGVR
jgi:hypothetical protein